jgi:glucokinase
MRARDLVLGIDIGGTKTAFGFVDREGMLFNAASMPTEAHESAEAFMLRLYHRIEEASAGLPSPHRLCGIGIGAPNAHHERGTIEKAANLNWGDIVDFVGLVRKYYDLPVSITNDAKTAAAGEMLFGNASGFAGELGHTVVDPEGRQCSCGKRGCLETYVSATGLTRTARELLATRCNSSALRKISDQDMTSKQIFDLAVTGDAIALEAFERTARILGMKLADAVAHLSPEAIFLAGGLAAAGDILLVPTAQYMNDFLFRAYRGTVKLMPCGLETGTSAILGAAALIWSELLSEEQPEHQHEKEGMI